MAEGFEVEPHYVSGYGLLMTAEQGNLGPIRDHVEYNARANPEHYTGLLSALVLPVNGYAASVVDRLWTRMDDVGTTADELARVAEEYLAIEAAKAEQFGDPPPTPEDPATFTPSAAELPTLEIEEMDFTEEFQDLGHTMFWITWFLVYGLGWSPHNDLINELAGNWNALDVAGDALINAGDAAEQVAKSMTDGLTILDAHWHGGAAQACTEYVTNLAGALGEEGPLNRTVGRLYKLLAERVREAIRQIIRDLKVPTEDIAAKLGYARVCWAWLPVNEASPDALETIQNYKELFDAAKGMVETIQSTVEEAQAFVESLVTMSEVSDARSLVDEMINAVAPWGQQAQDSIATTADLADLADTSEFAAAPAGGYTETGNLERDGA